MVLHLPVLSSIVADYLLADDRSTFIDCTLGGGGHAIALFENAKSSISIYGLDKDLEALKMAKERLADNKNITYLHGDFATLDVMMAKLGIDEVDGILADFGQSFDQIEDGQRGFSFKYDGPLDMRYGTHEGFTAADIINEYTKQELTSLIYHNSQERQASRIAAAIVRERPLYTTGQLADLIRRSSHRSFIEKTLARVFMALRVEVNDELKAIDSLLPITLSLLKPGGRAVFISYDSNQDSRVKSFFKMKSRTCDCPPNLPLCVCGLKPELKLLTRRV
ncbi:MAG: 16S rRNA (cytosine(1402)-N(4))-methyltransferase RsmH, partial [Calditrichaeota bacterium]|nr:16S rRNA (cytosine(1402)-N(4))-methyltransferase RsmH [Calditrichota bacterium]